MGYSGYPLHKISSKCGIFAEADANTLLKAGVPVEEIIASLFEAVVYQNLATLTRGNTPMPEILLLGGPNLFFKGLQEAWRHHLAKVWKERKVAMSDDREVSSLIRVPDNALYYAALGCMEVALRENGATGLYTGSGKLQWWIEEGQYEEKKKNGRGGLCKDDTDLATFKALYEDSPRQRHRPGRLLFPYRYYWVRSFWVAISVRLRRRPFACRRRRNCLFSCYALSKGNPIEDAKALFRQAARGGGDGEILGLAITGYGKDLLKGILGADCPVVETIAHASAGLHYLPRCRLHLRRRRRGRQDHDPE